MVLAQATCFNKRRIGHSQSEISFWRSGIRKKWREQEMKSLQVSNLLVLQTQGLFLSFAAEVIRRMLR